MLTERLLSLLLWVPVIFGQGQVELEVFQEIQIEGSICNCTEEIKKSEEQVEKKIEELQNQNKNLQEQFNNLQLKLVGIMEAIREDGGWGPFSDWSKCSASCGGGVQVRNRTCDNPAPKNGGKQCNGADVEQKACYAQQCQTCDVLWTGPSPSQTFLLPDFNRVHSDCQVADPGMDEFKSVFQEVEGKVYGCNHEVCKQYFPEENTWRIIPGTKFVSARRWAAGTLVDGKWVVQGGEVIVNGEYDDVPTAEVWTPGDESWVEAPEYKSPLPVSRHCMVTLKDKTLKTMQIGGYTSGALYGSTSRCFLDGKEVASLKAARRGHACAVFQGQVWVAGGIRDGGHQDVVEIYDPSTNTWREGPPRPTTAYDGFLQLLVEENTDQLYYIGGGSIGKIYRLIKNKDGWEEVADIQKGAKYAAIIMKKLC